MDDLELAINTFTAATSFGALCFGAYITLNQLRIAKQKVKIDLFDRRIDVYEQLRWILEQCISGIDQDSEDQVIVKSHYCKRMAKFLFNKEIEQTIETIHERVLKITTIYSRLQGPNAIGIGQKRNELSDEKTEIITKFLELLSYIDDVFAKDIGFIK